MVYIFVPIIRYQMVTLIVFHVIDSQTRFHRKIPTGSQQPCVSIRETHSSQSAFTMEAIPSHIIFGSRQVCRYKMSGVFFEYPITDSRLHSK